VQWSAAVRVSPFDDEMAIAAKNSYCCHLVIGVESFNQKKLDYMNKKTKVWQIKRTLDLFNKHKISYHGNVLVGFENETLSDINNEIIGINKEYNVLPALVQNFIGTRNGRSRLISNEESSMITDLFIEYANNKNMVFLPDAITYEN
jgi:radical SAM superfamily enzyme YgiQ (UPF0313 family)